ncbi:MAG: hypothetical protein LBN42_04735 [Oscillospiraceae bacterium]|jgi:hypothetical protein|nr:hypothetical protein [Oscillospiraceae bacterium]
MKKLFDPKTSFGGLFLVINLVLTFAINIAYMSTHKDDSLIFDAAAIILFFISADWYFRYKHAAKSKDIKRIAGLNHRKNEEYNFTVLQNVLGEVCFYSEAAFMEIPVLDGIVLLLIDSDLVAFVAYVVLVVLFLVVGGIVFNRVTGKYKDAMITL